MDDHYLDHPNGRGTLQPRVRPPREDERVFLAIGEGAERCQYSASARVPSRSARMKGYVVEAPVRRPFELRRGTAITGRS